MDCRTCQPTLIDLLYGELATDAAEAARAHLRECASCRAAYDKLAAGLRVARTLEIMEPPAQVQHKLLELAQARAVAIAEQRAAAAPPVLSPWRVAIDFVRRFAMASQVKMVAASALVVTVVLLALPRLLLPAKMKMTSVTEEPASVAPAAQATAAPKEEAAPADGVKPAEPLGLKMDSQSGRIRSAEENEVVAEVASRAQQFAEQQGAADLDRASKLRDEKKSAAPAEAVRTARPARAATGDAFADKRVAPEKAKPSAADDLALSGYRQGAPAQPAAAAPNPFPSSEGALAGGSVAKAKRGDELGMGLGAASSPSGALSTRSRSSGAGSATAGGMPAPAAKPASPAVVATPAREAETDRMQASAQPRAKDSVVSRLQTARAIAQRDGCAAALSSYEQVVAAGNSTLEAGEALLEMAHCRVTLGQPAIARALLERASRIPAVAPRARAMLESSAASNAPAATAAEPPK
jgi:hypothetical protein